MHTDQLTSPIPRPKANAMLLKSAWIFLLILLLQVPLLLVDSLKDERAQNRQEAISSISKRWGGRQVIVGPIIAVPFTYEQISMENIGMERRQVRRSYRSTAYFLPEDLKVHGAIETEERQLGIYATTVYSVKLRLQGHFGKLEFPKVGNSPVQALWNEARVFLSMDDVTGLREISKANLAGQSLEWEPGTGWSSQKSGVNAKLSDGFESRASGSFEIELLLNGTEDFGCVPVGRQTCLRLESKWPDPGFDGTYLPNSRKVSEAGFEAQWDLSHLARNLPQFWTDISKEEAPDWNQLRCCTAGVSLQHGITAYRLTDRALKHGILFLVLVFTAFFIFEASALRPLHMLHYGLVGGALCLFYLALLSLSEFLSFGLAYLCAASASSLLIGLYCRAILGKGTRAMVILLVLALVYAYLFFVLSMEDYALLAGTAALFVALGGIMWVTRKLRPVAEAPQKTASDC